MVVADYFDFVFVLPTVTATSLVMVTPPTVIEAVIVHSPAPAADTTPAATVATAVFEDFHVTVTSAGTVVAVTV